MPFYFLASLITGLDQLLKYLVDTNMLYGQSINIFKEAIRLTYVRNSGAAFSLFVGFSPYLMIVGFFVVGVVIYFHHRLPAKANFLQIALAFVLGGSLGNLIDRAFRSYVIDYLDFSVWPVFNLADIMINIGVAMLVLRLLNWEHEHVAHPH